LLYRSFASKDALVTAYIERAEVRYREWFDEAVAKGDSTAERIDALFRGIGHDDAAGSVSGLSVPDDDDRAPRRNRTRRM